MARPKNQYLRRNQLIEAAKKAITERGLAGLRIKDVSTHIDLTPGAVSYYYPDIEDLIRDVHQHEMDRFYWTRLREAEATDDPRDKICRTIKSGLPHGPDDIDYQVLNEMHVQAFREPFHARLMSSMHDREISLYIPILDTGLRQGLFEFQPPSTDIARNIVALEDAYGLHILGGSSISVADAYRAIVSYAEAATSCPLANFTTTA